MKSVKEYSFDVFEFWVYLWDKLITFIVYIFKVRFIVVYTLAGILNLYLKVWDNTFQMIINKFRK